MNGKHRKRFAASVLSILLAAVMAVPSFAEEFRALQEPETVTQEQTGESSAQPETAVNEDSGAAETAAQTDGSAAEEETAEAPVKDPLPPEAYRIVFPELGKVRKQMEELDFSSRRLIVGTDKPSIFLEDVVILSEYNGVYLLQFEDEKTAKAAYLYYACKADFVEVDTGMGIAEDESDDVIKEESSVQPESRDGASTDENAPEEENITTTGTVMTEEENPFTELTGILEEEEAQKKQQEEEAEETGEELPEEKTYDIALIDTGADRVEDSVSLIREDTKDENGHGTAMASAIYEQNPDAEILSIKALDKDGVGDISTVYAAMQYAIEKQVKIINLSISALATEDSRVIEEAVKDAKKKKILVVGAAGNNGKDAKYFVPGRIEDAVVMGACDENGTRLSASNYGESVDYSKPQKTRADREPRAYMRFREKNTP